MKYMIPPVTELGIRPAMSSYDPTRLAAHWIRREREQPMSHLKHSSSIEISIFWVKWLAATLVANGIVALLGLSLQEVWGWETYQTSDEPALLLGALSGGFIGVLQWLVLRERIEAHATFIIATALCSLPLLFLLTAPLSLGFGLGVVGSGGMDFYFIAFSVFWRIVAGAFLGAIQALTLRSTRTEWWIPLTTIGVLCGFIVAVFVQADDLGIKVKIDQNYRSTYFYTIVWLFEFWVCVSIAQGVSLTRLFRKQNDPNKMVC